MPTQQHITEKASTETVTGVKWWNDRLLSFTTTRAPEYSFVAGQYARLGLQDETGIIWRAYSMVSAPAESELEFYGVIVPNGLFTARLKRLEVGASILVERQPYGFMTVDRFPDGEDLWLLATGTGIGPYVSMLREGALWKTFRNVVLVHGVRLADEFAYHDELEGMQGMAGPAGRLKIIKAVTRDSAPGTLDGRITTLLDSGALENEAGLKLETGRSRVMMCGNPAMIEDMRGILHRRGMKPQRRLAPGQFVTENYW